ncbi:MAG: asparagine--tRNA ligase [Candidatus Micrarchaeia archaeon]
MAKRIFANEANKHVGEEIALAGWVYRKRESGGIVFIVMRDSTGILQIAVKKDSVKEKDWQNARDSTIESSIKVVGTVKQDERAPTGYEVSAKSFENVQVAEPFPITEYQSPELLLDKRHLWLRSQRMTAILKARSYVFRYAREFLDKRGFFEITPPIITMAGGETGADLFEVNYFGQKAYLTESSQLYAEALIFALEKVYSFAPSFRAEKSRTTKHLAEFWHLEPEMAYYDINDNMRLQERLVSYIANKLAEHEDILKTVGVDPETLKKVKPPFKRVKYEEALEIINSKDPNEHLKWGDDFGVPEEKLLTEDEEKPIFVTDWPREVKAFYASPNPKDPRTVLSDDMQAPHGHGEIIGGTERVWTYDELMERIREFEKAKGIKFNLENYDWWIDLRRYGAVPHAGFGMGLERLIKWLLNLDHIRDAIPFPRLINRAKP